LWLAKKERERNGKTARREIRKAIERGNEKKRMINIMRENQEGEIKKRSYIIFNI